MSFARLVLLAVFLTMIGGGEASIANNCAPVLPAGTGGAAGLELKHSKELLLARQARLLEEREKVEQEISRLYLRISAIQERIDQSKGRLNTLDDSISRVSLLLKEVDKALAYVR